MNCKALALAAVATVALSAHAQARDTIQIVGSSTVFPFATAVAENFGKTTDFNTPVIESTGSGGGMKLFCKGVGVEHPDVTNASRRIKAGEFESCQANGVTPIEIKVGYDGIVMANAKSGPTFELSKKDIFLALGSQVPSTADETKLVPNFYEKWSDIRAGLPNVKIEVLGPPPTSGTRDAFSELALEGGAKKIGWMSALRKAKPGEEAYEAAQGYLPAGLFEKDGKAIKGKKVFQAVAHAIREDGAYVEAGENDNLIVNKLASNPDALGVFGFSFLDQNADKLKGATVDGEAPTFEAIAAGDYGVSRSLFFYVKKEHVGVVPGIEGYLAEWTAESTWGPDGYLADKGLIPMPEEERAQFKAAADELTPLAL